MNHTRLLPAALALLLLSGCSGPSQPPAASTRSPEELTEDYSSAISAHGGEMVEANPVVTQLTPETAPLLEYMGLSDKNMIAFAASTSMMNVKAYGIAAVMPAPGSEEAVKAALQNFIDRQIMSFEFYLPDQREIAKNARLETLTDGTVLLVMTEHQDTVFDNIAQAIQS